MKAQTRDWWRMKNNSNSWIEVRVCIHFSVDRNTPIWKKIFPPRGYLCATTGNPGIIGDHHFCFFRVAPPIEFSICAGRRKALENVWTHWFLLIGWKIVFIFASHKMQRASGPFAWWRHLTAMIYWFTSFQRRAFLFRGWVGGWGVVCSFCILKVTVKRNFPIWDFCKIL